MLSRRRWSGPTAGPRKWHIRLGAAAELDFANILKWTTENFGARQSRVYRNTIVRPIGELADGLDVAGSKARDEIIPGLRTLHVARQGRGGSHFLMYRIASNSTIEIVRILHNRMDDLQRHVPLVDNFLSSGPPDFLSWGPPAGAAF